MVTIHGQDFLWPIHFSLDPVAGTRAEDRPASVPTGRPQRPDCLFLFIVYLRGHKLPDKCHQLFLFRMVFSATQSALSDPKILQAMMKHKRGVATIKSELLSAIDLLSGSLDRRRKYYF